MHLSANHYLRRWKTRHEDYQGNFAGRNTLVRITASDALDEIRAMENFWPGEDYAIRDIIVEHGGSTYKTPHLFAAVATDASRYPITSNYPTLDEEQAALKMLKQSYVNDCPPGGMRYFRPTDPTYRQVDDSDTPLAN